MVFFPCSLLLCLWISLILDLRLFCTCILKFVLWFVGGYLEVLYVLRHDLTFQLAVGGGGGSLNPPWFFSLKFLPLDQLPNAFAQPFLDNEDIF